MNIGVIGLGYWGSKHVRVLSALPEVSGVTVYDVAQSRVRTIQQAFPAAAAAQSIEQLLSVVDGVVVATHPSSHAPLAMAALHAGRHVLVEKPLALDSHDAESLVVVAEALGLTLMVGHTFVYNPAVQALRTMVQRGDLGEVMHLSSQRLNLGLYQSDCDVVWDLAPHDISIVSTVLGSRVTSVQGWGTGHIDRDVVDNAHIRLGFLQSSAEAVVHVSWLDPHKVRQLTVVGSEKMAVYDDLADDLKLRIYDKSVRLATEPVAHEKPMTYRHGDMHSPFIPPQEPLMLEDKHFVECILTGQTPLTDGRAGVEVVRTLEAASEAMRSGSEVLMPPRHDRSHPVSAPRPRSVSLR